MSETTALTPTPPQLPEQVSRRGVTEAQWRTLSNNLFPGANPNSVLMVIDYCAARKLDPMKKPCHIVPMEVRDAKTGDYSWRDVVMPGVYEYRITAHRTGEYLGHEKATYGPDIEYMGVKAPEWCEMTVYRWNRLAGVKVPYTVTLYFTEVVATTWDKKTQTQKVNARWTRAPRQMLAKCVEAAALREAFPEEIGGEPTAEEMEGQRHVQVIDMPPVPQSALDRIPEAMRDNIDRAFEALGLPGGMRLAKAAEFLGGDGVMPEEGAQKLLDWCKDEYAKRKTGKPRQAKGEGNGKRTNAADAGRADSAPAPTTGSSASSQGPSPSADHSTGGEDRPAPPVEGHPSGVSHTTPVTASADNAELF